MDLQRRVQLAEAEWGPLAEPMHPEGGSAATPWRENAYLGFWSLRDNLYGEVHVSASPNAPGRARVSLSVDGQFAEVIEPLDGLSFQSPSIDFGLDGRVMVESSALGVALQAQPRFAYADYTPNAAMVGLVKDAPLHHYEQGVSVTGSVRVGATTVEVEGRGFRDRTWGFRDEASSWSEVLTIWGNFEDFDLVCMKLLGADGRTRVDGWVLSDGMGARVTDLRPTYGPAGVVENAHVAFDDGSERVVTVTNRAGVLWVPLGTSRDAPTLTIWDDFVTLDAWGVEGEGVIGNIISRNL